MMDFFGINGIVNLCTEQSLVSQGTRGKSEHIAPDRKIGKSKVVGNAHPPQGARCEQRRRCSSTQKCYEGRAEMLGFLRE